MKRELVTARIRSSHGAKGCVRAVSMSGETEHLLSLSHVVLRKGERERVLEVEHAEQLGKDVLLKLAGVDTPEDARRYSTWEIWVDRSAAAEASDDEYFVADLVGCGVVVDGAVRGTVNGVFESRESAFLEIRTVSGDGSAGTVLIPFSERSVGEIDVDAGRIEIVESWLLD